MNTNRDIVIGFLEEARVAYNAKETARAIQLLSQAIALDATCTPAYDRLAKIYEESGRYTDAIAAREIVLKHEPTATNYCQLGELTAEWGDMARGLALFKKARDIAPREDNTATSFLFHLQYANHLPEAAVFMEHARYGELWPVPPPLPLAPHSDGKIHIGYVSPDFRKHAIAYWILPLFRHHDRARFHLTAYCGMQPHAHDETTEIFQKYADDWCEVATMKDEELAAQIARDGIDILVDLTGHTGNHRLPLFARRAAPIQVSWYGYLNTTGLRTMDYRITDEYFTPRDRAKFYAEELVYLPRACAFESWAGRPAPTPLPALKNGFVTFSSFNAIEKINDEVLDLWARVLVGVPRSRFAAIITPSDEYKARLVARLAERGVDPSRIEITYTKKFEDFLAFAQETDLALDTFPYTGGATVFHLLSVGVPTVTHEGRQEAHRNAGGILRHAGLTDFVATTFDEYVEKAIGWANNLQKLSEVRAKIPPTIGTDGATVTRDFEKAFEAMYGQKKILPV